MAYIGGQLTEITWNHPTKGSGTLSPKASENSTLDTGGVRSDDEKAGIAGDGTAIRKMNLQRWHLDTVIANDMNVGLQAEAMVALSGDPAETVFTISHINGSVYKGSGFPVGDISADTGNATFKLILQGSGLLQKIA